MIVEELNLQLKGFDQSAYDRSVDHWNSVAKPIGSLGVLETIISRIAGMTGSDQVKLDKRCVLAMCADNGVVAEGVTQSDQDITTVVAENMARYTSSVCRMGAVAGVKVVPVDLGMANPSNEPGLVQHSLGRGTANMTQGPAMTREQALDAISFAIDMVGSLKEQGFDIIATGEMGIGNTTTSSAVASVLMGLPVEELTGRGAGLSGEGLARKVNAIKKAIQVNEPDPSDALDVLSKVGGFDIAGMAGTFIGGAVHGVPILIDGFISSIAALIAIRLCPQCRDFMIATHVSAEPAGMQVLKELGLEPVVHAGMRLGEGTGAVTLIPLLDMALALYNGSSFDDFGIEAYEVDLK